MVEPSAILRRRSQEIYAPLAAWHAPDGNRRREGPRGPSRFPNPGVPTTCHFRSPCNPRPYHCDTRRPRNGEGGLIGVHALLSSEARRRILLFFRNTQPSFRALQSIFGARVVNLVKYDGYIRTHLINDFGKGTASAVPLPANKARALAPGGRAACAGNHL